MLSYLLLSSASFALPIPLFNRGKCVDVTGHELKPTDSTPTDSTQASQESTEITAKFCLRGNGLNVRLNKPSGEASGLTFQAPVGEGSPMRCKRILGVLGRNVCQTRFKTATDGDYKLQYEGPNGTRTVVFSFTSPGDRRKLPTRRVTTGTPRSATTVRVTGTAGTVTSIDANGDSVQVERMTDPQIKAICDDYGELARRTPVCRDYYSRHPQK